MALCWALFCNLTIKCHSVGPLCVPATVWISEGKFVLSFEGVVGKCSAVGLKGNAVKSSSVISKIYFTFRFIYAPFACRKLAHLNFKLHAELFHMVWTYR